LITEIKFSSPSLGKIRTLSDPVSIAQAMITGGAKALSVLTQPNLFNGSPDYFMQVRKAVDVPMLMKDIIINKVQIDAAEKMGADYMLLIQSLFDQNYLKEIDEFIEYAHKKGLKVLVEAHSKSEFENALKKRQAILTPRPMPPDKAMFAKSYKNKLNDVLLRMRQEGSVSQ